ncbi:Cacna1e [Symbiodinium necroappetens]|uniref:Cacna1e protein n=1 Tax=Symbiodinium necroappetens TaxID=1628268 RepID=A0A812IZB7_9DINO|nr:Cacna1e [Symbiodinium necroappetens]
MEPDPSPQLLEVLRSHQEEITVLLDTWMSRLSAQLAGCWVPESTMSVGRSGSPRRELEPLPLDPLDPLDACDSAESAGSDCEPPMDISGEKVRQEATDSNEKVDSSYVLARQTDHRILTAFNKLTSFTIYGPNHPKKAKRLSGWAGVRARVKALMSSHASHMFWAMVIMTNSVYLGVHLDWSVDHRGSSGNPTFFALHLVYALLFTLEVGLRIIAWGCRALLWGQDWHWNWLDLFVVISSWVEFALDLANSAEDQVSRGNSNFRLMRLLRLGRLVRVVRIVRVVRLFRALRTLVASLAGTLKSLFWSFLLLGLIIYIFAILFTDIVLDHLIEYDVARSRDDPMQFYFGNLYSSSTTLYRSISNGLTWHLAADSLGPAGEFWVQAYNFFVAFSAFCVLNVMTGVFCNSAIKAAENDHELAVQASVQMRKELKDQVVQLFGTIDERGLGQLTISEFERHFDNDAVKAFFEVLKIGAVDAWTLFTSLDKDGDHTVNVDEFVERCLSDA